jgi:5-methylcytosine-specific restriction endonuclease McrA
MMKDDDNDQSTRQTGLSSKTFVNDFNREGNLISTSKMSSAADTRFRAAADSSRVDGYQAYINSKAWKTNPARLNELKAAGHRCRICNRSEEECRLEVHHRTYENFGRERDGDLTTLCEECHRCVTSELRGRRYAKRSPAFADIPSTDPRLAPFDPIKRGEWS